LSEIDQIAAEIGIDPSILRQALNAIAEKEAATAAESVRSQMTAHSSVARETQQRRAIFMLPVALGVTGVLLMTLMIGARAPRMSAATLAPPQMVPPQEASPATAPQSLTNGGFELGPGKNVRLSTGSESLPGWTIVGGRVFYLPESPAGGSTGALHLAESGAVRQLFPTQPGQSYQLQLRLTGLPKSVNSGPRVRITIGNISTEVDAFVPAKGAGAAQWAEKFLPFQATASGSTVEITNLNASPSDGSPVIDDVRLVPVAPSPSMPLAQWR
jgi:hypothetical protein